MSDEISTAADETGSWMDKLPLWGPVILLIVLIPVLAGGEDESAANAAPMPAAAVEAPASQDPVSAVHTDDAAMAAAAVVEPELGPAPQVAATLPAWPVAPALPQVAGQAANPWAPQQAGAFARYAQPQQFAQPPMPGAQAAPQGAPAVSANSPYVPCQAPYYWCVPALPGSTPQ